MADIAFGPTFRANTRDYSRANAYWLGQASLLAYATPPEIQTAVAGWGLKTDFQFFDKLETQAYIAGDDRLLILAFRGTTELLDWIQDAQFDLVAGPGGRVHEGFLVALSFVWREVLDFIQTKRNGRAIWVTGHSLGAALAALAVAKLRLERDEPLNGLYTFGQPRGGDQAYANAFDANFGPQTFRYVNDRDIVARVPLRLMQYSHVGTFKYFDAKGVQQDKANWDDIIKRRISAPIRDLIPPILPVTDFLVPNNPADFAALISRNVQEFDDHRMDHYVENLERALRQEL